MTPKEQRSLDSPSTRATLPVSTSPTSPRTVPVSTLDTLEALHYDRETNSYRGEYDPRIDPPFTVVVQSVAALADRSPLDLDPLYQDIDGEVLDTLLGSPTTRDDSSEVRLAFTFAGYDVTHYSHGVIEVSLCEGDDEVGIDRE